MFSNHGESLLTMTTRRPDQHDGRLLKNSLRLELRPASFALVSSMFNMLQDIRYVV